MFCPECGGMVIPRGGSAHCARCGIDVDAGDEREVFVDPIVRTPSGADPTLVGVRSCPSCGRGAYPVDGPGGVRFYTCTYSECRRTWRRSAEGFAILLYRTRMFRAYRR